MAEYDRDVDISENEQYVVLVEHIQHCYSINVNVLVEIICNYQSILC